MLRMRKTDVLQDERWRVEEIELGDVTRPLQEQPLSSSVVDADVDLDSDLVPLVAGSKPQAIKRRQGRGRHTTFRVDGLVALSTALQVAAAITLAFFLVGGPILCCLLTLTVFYLLVAYSTKTERQQERDDLASMERDLNGSGSGGVVGVFHFVSGQCSRLYQRLVALKQSVINYSLTVSIAESQAMLDLDEIVHGGRRRRSSLLPCVESECVDDMRIDSEAVMENILVVDHDVTKHKDWGIPMRRPMSKPFELRPVHLESLARRTDRSQSLPLPPMMPLEEEDQELRWVQPEKQDSMGSTESEEEDDDTETEPDAERYAMVEAEVEIEPVIPPLPVPVPVMPQDEDEDASFSESSSDSEEDEEGKEEEEVVASPRMSMLSSSMTMKTASAAASKAMHSAVKALAKLPNKLQIPVLLSRPLPRLVVHRAPSKLTPSQHVRRMLDETDKMEAELEEMLARNAAFFQAFEDSRESLELSRRAPDEDELSHNAFSSGEEEGEFWYEDTLGADFLDDVPPYLRTAETETETEFQTEFQTEVSTSTRLSF